MSAKIKTQDLSKELKKYFEEYNEDIEDIAKETVQKISKEAKAELKETSPVRKGENGGSYAKGWTLRTRMVGKRFIIDIHNKTDYQLTHLLEFGHANRDGSRTKAIPHIRPVEKKYSEKLTNELKEKIRSKSK